VITKPYVIKYTSSSLGIWRIRFLFGNLLQTPKYLSLFLPACKFLQWLLSDVYVKKIAGYFRWSSEETTAEAEYKSEEHREDLIYLNMLVPMIVNNQLDALFYCTYLFIPLLYMFRAIQCPSSGESNCISTSSGICHSV
jgi:hypothetical protein